MTTQLRDAALDLLLGASCVGCARPGRLLCPDCAARLPGQAHPCGPDPTPPGMAPSWASAPYDGTVRAMVLGLKERRLLSLARPLGRLLAPAITAALADVPPGAPVVLVPVPSRRASVRARGHDPTWAMTLHAAVLVRRAGLSGHPSRLLRVRSRVRDQSGLDAAARAANLAGAMWCPTGRLRRLRGRRAEATGAPAPAVVVCDDVITTGSTAREAQRALEAAGLHVVGVAAVAATLRRTPRVHF